MYVLRGCLIPALIAVSAAVVADAEPQQNEAAPHGTDESPVEEHVVALLDRQGIREVAIVIQGISVEQVQPSGCTDAWVAPVRDAFDPEALYGVLVARMVDHYDRDRADGVARFYDSALGRKVLEAETRPSQQGQTHAILPALANLMQDQSRSAERMALVDELNRSAGVAKAVARVQALVKKTLWDACGTFDGEEDPQGFLATMGRLAELEAKRKLLYAANLNALVAYHELSDQELKRYVDFLESQDGRWFAEALGQALVEAAAERARLLENAPA